MFLRFAVLLLLVACSNRPAVEQSLIVASDRSAGLASHGLLPARDLFTRHDFDWQDVKRARLVPVRLYLPAGAVGTSAVPTLRVDIKQHPLMVFSHGIGGSREGYSYIGQYLASRGVASLHVQHIGSDNRLWRGNVLSIASRLQDAAAVDEALARAKDLRFALDTLLNDTEFGKRINQQQIFAAGHSYGANTVMLVAGARIDSYVKNERLLDARIKAVVLISAPPFYGENNNTKDIVSAIQVPNFHLTAEGDTIQVPGHYSPVSDRYALYQAMGGKKQIAVFKGGSHSMFTDRLNTGGEINPEVKRATQELVLAFVLAQVTGDEAPVRAWREKFAGLLS